MITMIMSVSIIINRFWKDNSEWIKTYYYKMIEYLNYVGILICSAILILYSYLIEVSITEKRPRDTTYSTIAKCDDEKQSIPPESVIDELESIFNLATLENVPTQVSITEKRLCDTAYSTVAKNDVEKQSIPPESVIGELESIFNHTPLENVPTQVSITEKRPCDTTCSTIAKINGEKQSIPPESVIDELEFIFNHTTLENVPTQCAKIKKILPRKYLPWFSQYLVRRVSESHDFQSLLDACVASFNSKLLNELIYSETVQRINLLIEKNDKPQSDKTIMINLGHWLGLITLAKGIPQPYDLEDLIDTASDKLFEKQFVIPLVMNILKSCKGIEVTALTYFEILTTLTYFAEILETSYVLIMFKNEIIQLCEELDVVYKELKFER